MAERTVTVGEAVNLLNAGGVVGVPTETVYGLAADARRDDAVARVFELKGRPSTNPLIVHVASVDVGDRYAAIDDRARQLFATFSPGPLTIVLPLLTPSPGTPREGRGEGLPRSSGADPHPNPLPGYRERGPEAAVSRLVTAGLTTVGIRIPDHPLALELLRAFDGPVAAPSANRSNHVSPTTAAHVRDEFGDDVSVLDGGPCRVGIESTVLSLATTKPTILRPGSVSREAIEAVIGPVEMFRGHIAGTIAATSPGQQERHYAPRSPAYRADPASVDQIAARGEFAVLNLPADPAEASRVFYARLRDLDATHPAAILIPMPPDEPRWAALRDRITRATQPYAGANPQASTDGR